MVSICVLWMQLKKKQREHVPSSTERQNKLVRLHVQQHTSSDHEERSKGKLSYFSCWKLWKVKAGVPKLTKDS